MIKYAANAFLATKISFINEVAALCERVGADVNEVARGMGLDGRIGNKFLHAGPGYGGSCFPKDTSALARTGQEFGVPQRITETVIAVNDMTKRRMIDKVMDLCGGSVNGRRIAVPGVTWMDDPYAAAYGADCLVILTEWNAFRALDLQRLATSIATPCMADLRNIYDPADAWAAGFTAVESVGRAGISKPTESAEAAQ